MMHEEVAGNTGSAALLARVEALIGAELREVERLFQSITHYWGLECAKPELDPA